jgi:hypothetical protein
MSNNTNTTPSTPADYSLADAKKAMAAHCCSVRAAKGVKVAARQLDVGRLQALYEYNPLSGLFISRARIGSRPAGSVAGSRNKDGYICIRIDGVSYYAHRLALLYVEGVYPAQVVDHINRCRSDNRYVNLRDVSVAVNNQNRTMPARKPKA